MGRTRDSRPAGAGSGPGNPVSILVLPAAYKDVVAIAILLAILVFLCAMKVVAEILPRIREDMELGGNFSKSGGRNLTSPLARS